MFVKWKRLTVFPLCSHFTWMVSHLEDSLFSIAFSTASGHFSGHSISYAEKRTRWQCLPELPAAQMYEHWHNKTIVPSGSLNEILQIKHRHRKRMPCTHVQILLIFNGHITTSIRNIVTYQCLHLHGEFHLLHQKCLPLYLSLTISIKILQK